MNYTRVAIDVTYNQVRYIPHFVILGATGVSRHMLHPKSAAVVGRIICKTELVIVREKRNLQSTAWFGLRSLTI